MKSFQRPLEFGQATAISYGIGDFDRQKHLLGHFDEPTREPISLELGGEWDVEGVMKSLVALSKEHRAIWLDQLSMPQDPVSISIHLQKMPQVYREFEVVILLPNAPCPCLKDAFESWTMGGTNGDFNLQDAETKCLNAFPVSSYHFRLWTRQEFTYARRISIHYCRAPDGHCSRGTIDHDWLYGATRIPTSSPSYLNPWASWKHASCVEQTNSESEYAEKMVWSIFRDAHVVGRRHLWEAVIRFLAKIDIERVFKLHLSAEMAKFLLGARLDRTYDKYEEPFGLGELESEHVASVQKDFALALLPSFKGYRVPHESASMTLPELMDDGIDQLEYHNQARGKTRLPKGLFEFGNELGSMRCKPSIFLRTESIQNLGDVYGSMWGGEFQRLDSLDVTGLRLRDKSSPASRMAESKTYEEALGGATTRQVRDFMRKAGESNHGNFERSRVRELKAWATAMYSNKSAIPITEWPSRAHEQAIFEDSLRVAQPWGSLPEIDHARVCYELMCNYVCINPDVAREKHLGLVVKTSDPPCMGFVNGMFYDRMRDNERCQQHLRVQTPPTAPQAIGNAILPEEWLTIMVTSLEFDDPGRRYWTLEAVKVARPVNLAEHVRIGESGLNESVPVYMVMGVWFWCPRDDPCVGAELFKGSDETYDAVLC